MMISNIWWRKWWKGRLRWWWWRRWWWRRWWRGRLCWWWWRMIAECVIWIALGQKLPQQIQWHTCLMTEDDNNPGVDVDDDAQTQTQIWNRNSKPARPLTKKIFCRINKVDRCFWWQWWWAWYLKDNLSSLLALATLWSALTICLV